MLLKFQCVLLVDLQKCFTSLLIFSDGILTYVTFNITHNFYHEQLFDRQN